MNAKAQCRFIVAIALNCPVFRLETSIPIQLSIDLLEHVALACVFEFLADLVKVFHAPRGKRFRDSVFAIRDTIRHFRLESVVVVVRFRSTAIGIGIVRG